MDAGGEPVVVDPASARWDASPVPARKLIVALLAGTCLAAPGSAGAAPVVFGSDLQAAPNLTVDCSQQPQVFNVNGDMALFASGQPDCTWKFSGVFGAAASDSRGSTVPGDGTITRADVRSGPTPAPLRFVVLQQVESVCCYFVSETDPVPLVPNAVTTVPLSLPVERNTIGGVQVYDFVAVSAASGTGSLPLSSNGMTNSFQQTVPGNPSSAVYYPRMGSVPGDGRPGGGRHEQGAPGTELLVRWTWSPPADPTPPAGVPATTTPNGNPNASIAPALLNRTLRVQNNRALIQLLCRGDAACSGQLDLVNRTALRATTKPLATYGKARYTIKPGVRAKVKITLNARGKALLKRRRTLKIGLRITPKGGKPRTTSITLKR